MIDSNNFLMLRPNLIDNSPPNHNLTICESIREALRFFGLDSDISLTLSGHSGTSHQYDSIYIQLNVCNPIKFPPRLQFFEVVVDRNNSLVMTDVLGSRAFGPNAFNVPIRGPQVVQIRYNNKRQYIQLVHLIDRLSTPIPIHDQQKIHQSTTIWHMLNNVNKKISLVNMPGVEDKVRLPQHLRPFTI